MKSKNSNWFHVVYTVVCIRFPTGEIARCCPVYWLTDLERG